VGVEGEDLDGGVCKQVLGEEMAETSVPIIDPKHDQLRELEMEHMSQRALVANEQAFERVP
jgi:hypothetical protein